MQQALFDSLPLAALPAPSASSAAGGLSERADAARQRWWRLQGRARQAGRAVEPVLVTPHFLARIDAACCPVTRTPIGPRAGRATPLRDDAAVAAGHLVTLGPPAAAAAVGRSWADALAVAATLAEPGAPAQQAGLDAPAWRRLAVLRSFVQPLTPAQAGRLPLHVLPPPRLRVLSPVQALQVAATLALLAPQRGERLCRLAALAAGEDLRQALRVFVLTLLARCPADLAARDALAQRQALEDLWADPLLARRWQRAAERLGDAAATRLLAAARRQGLLGAGWRPLDAAAAVDGWDLPAPQQRPRKAG